MGKFILRLNQNKQKVLQERSAVYWAERTNILVLLLRGGSDCCVNLKTQTMTLVKQLQTHQKDYRSIVSEADDHFLSFNRQDSHQQIISWFKSHLQ